MLQNNKLPKNWKIVNLKNITESIQYGYTESSSKSNIGPKFLRITDIQENKVSWDNVPYCKIDSKIKHKYLLKDGDLLFARTGATVGKSFLIKGQIPEAVFASYLIRVRINLDINETYISYFFHSPNYWSQITEGQVGIGQPNVNGTKLGQLQIPIAPIENQNIIVSKIEELFSELDKGIENLKTAQQQLKIYRQSVLKWAFEGKLTKEWRKRGTNLNTASILLNKIQVEKENEAKRIGKKLKPTNSLTVNDISQLSKLPENWRWVSLGEVISDLTDYHANGSYVKIKENVELLDIPNYAIMIRATNFEKNNFNENLKYITENAYNYMSRSKLFGGEILIGKIGNAGRIYFMPTLKSPSSLAMNLFALRFNVDVNKYVYYHLLSSFSKQEISKYVKGVGNPTIDKNSIRSLSIALPSFEEQYQIVQEIESRLSVADKMEESITQSLQQAETLRQSILKKAFSGELI